MNRHRRMRPALMSRPVPREPASPPEPKPKRSRSTSSDPWAYRPVRRNGKEWLPELAAEEYIGRGRTSLWEWRSRGVVEAFKAKLPNGKVRWFYSRPGLRMALRDADRRRREQVRVAGPGRGYRGPMDRKVIEAQKARHRAKREAEAAAAAEALAERRRLERERERLEDEAFERGELT